MSEYVGAIGRGISGLVANSIAAVGDALGKMGNMVGDMLHTIGGIVPGGLPIFAVLVTIGILVFWATLKR
jgi:hypothetical protein